ncbi:MAG: family 16 glycoside hydrolase [Pirellulaceae bacterium]
MSSPVAHTRGRNRTKPSPKTNAQTEPGTWNKYVIDFRAPRFDANGKRTEKAKFIKIELNGQTIHENVEMNGPTPSGVTGKESPEGGPLMFQGDHGPVAFRNITMHVIQRR